MSIQIRQEIFSQGSPPVWKIEIIEDWSIGDCQSKGELENFLHEKKINYKARPDYSSNSTIFELNTMLTFEAFDPMAETLLRLLAFKNMFVIK